MDKATVLSKYLTHVLPTLVLSPMPSVHWQQWPPPPVSSRPRTFISARLPNRRIEHGVVQRKNVDWVSFRNLWDCSSSHGYVRWVGKCSLSFGAKHVLRLQEHRLGLGGGRD